MLLKKYSFEDCAATAKLFYDTVHAVNKTDYTPRQLDAWADGNTDLNAWHLSLQRHLSYIAVLDGVLAGFGDMDKSGYLDRLYIHKDYQRRGVASALCRRLEQESGADIFTTHSSITAKPFFIKKGYTVIRKQQVERKGILLTNYVMEKHTAVNNIPLPPSGKN